MFEKGSSGEAWASTVRLMAARGRAIPRSPCRLKRTRSSQATVRVFLLSVILNSLVVRNHQSKLVASDEIARLRWKNPGSSPRVTRSRSGWRRHSPSTLQRASGKGSLTRRGEPSPLMFKARHAFKVHGARSSACPLSAQQRTSICPATPPDSRRRRRPACLRSDRLEAECQPRVDYTILNFNNQ